MPVTTIGLAMNIAIGFAVWQSQLPGLAKMVITAVLLGKYAWFFCAAWMSERAQMRKIGVAGCIVLNIAIIIYAVVKQELLPAISTAGLLVLLLIWAAAAVYDFNPKSKQK